MKRKCKKKHPLDILCVRSARIRNSIPWSAMALYVRHISCMLCADSIWGVYTILYHFSFSTSYKKNVNVHWTHIIMNVFTFERKKLCKYSLSDYSFHIIVTMEDISTASHLNTGIHFIEWYFLFSLISHIFTAYKTVILSSAKWRKKKKIRRRQIRGVWATISCLY